MLRRFTSVTGLLVVAASVTSMVPVIAADLKTADIQAGTIYSAAAEGGGTYIIDADINNDDEAYYFVADGKYTKLDADTSDTLSDFYSNKYAEFKDTNGDYYYVDVTTGKQTDEYDRQTIIDDMERKVRDNIKKDNDGRFEKSDYTNNTVKADSTGDGAVKVFISGATGTWSKFTYNLEKANINGETTSAVLAGIDGNYVDADYNLGHVPVYTTTGSSVTFTNTKDTCEITENGKTYVLKAQIKNTNAFDEEPDAIYRTAHLTIWRKEKDEDDTKYQNITDKVEFGGKNNHHSQIINNEDNSVTVMQKISKAQASDTIDGIKYAKNVMTCFITDSDGNEAHAFGLGDVSDLGTSIDWTGGDVALVTGSMDGIASHFYDASEKKYYAQNVNLKLDKGYYYTDIGDYDETDADSWSIGAGNLYCVGDGYVKKWICKDSKFEKIYKVDSGLSTISTAFGDSAIVWNQDKEIYSILNKEATSKEQKDAATTTGAAATFTTVGWVKDNNETWSYFNTDGSKKTGWLNDGGTWYYLKADGVMSTGWVNDNATWYYCNASGTMLFNTTVDGYVLGANGAWVK